MLGALSQLFGYWEMWHFLLATWLFFIFLRYIPNITIQKAFLLVLAVALAWELAEFIWNRDAYSTFQAQFINSAKDMGAALISVGVSAIIVKGKRFL